MFGTIGRQDPPSMTHPQFYFGFLGVTATSRWALFVAQGREGIDGGGAARGDPAGQKRDGSQKQRHGSEGR